MKDKADRRALRGAQNRVRLAVWSTTALGALCTAWMTLSTPGSGGDLPGYLLYLPMCLLSALTILSVRALVPGSHRRGWLLIGLAVLSWGLGEASYAYLDELARAQTFPSVADAFYLAFIPLFAAGLLQFPRERLARRQAFAFLLDIAIAVVVVGDILWHTGNLSQTVRNFADEPLAALLSVAYPASDLLLSATLLVMVLWRPRALNRLQLLLLGLGMALFLAADLGYGYQESRGRYVEWGLIDGLWTWGMVLFAWAAYAGVPGSRRSLAERVLGPSSEHTRRLRVLLPHVVVAVAYGSFTLLHARHPHEAGLGPNVTLVTLLILLRHVIAARDTHELSHQLARSSNLDPLTGLLSRQGLEQVVTAAIEEAEVTHRTAAVLFIDLDRMKHVNDWYGHLEGDQVLREVSRRLKQLVRSEDAVARFGGDEFVVVLRNLDGVQDVRHVAQRMLGAIARPVTLNGDAVYVTASMGVAVCPLNASTAELALHYAYLAVHQAKQQGRNAWRFFDDRLSDDVRNEGQLESQLRHAIRNDQLSLHYQPLVRLEDRHALGFEALLRWKTVTHGDVAPDVTVRLAEERGLIVPLGTWVLERAAQQVARWRVTLHPDVYVSVNVSALQFRDEQFVDEVERVLLSNRLPGSALMIELTESHLVSDLEASVRKIEALRQQGVRVALDDFGTGYSSLSYLRELPVDVLKIDRSFLAALDARGEAFVQAIMTLAHSLQLLVVCEGIETEAQLLQLHRLGCDVGQGYLLGRPAPAAQAEAAYESLPPVLIETTDAGH